MRTKVHFQFPIPNISFPFPPKPDFVPFHPLLAAYFPFPNKNEISVPKASLHSPTQIHNFPFTPSQSPQLQSKSTNDDHQAETETAENLLLARTRSLNYGASLSILLFVLVLALVLGVFVVLIFTVILIVCVRC
jgi:hypothetical protein